MHQLDMTEFIVDLNQYLKVLASAQTLAKEAATASKNGVLVAIMKCPLPTITSVTTKPASNVGNLGIST